MRVNTLRDKIRNEYMSKKLEVAATKDKMRDQDCLGTYNIG